MKKDEQLGVSRRSFLKGAGLAAAAMAGTAALAGGDGAAAIRSLFP